MQSKGTCVEDACQFGSVLENRREVCVVRMLDLSRVVGSIHSCLNTLRVELNSHADTCVVGNNAVVVHMHPNVGMVSSLGPLQPP